jgi:hypothetical protein
LQRNPPLPAAEPSLGTAPGPALPAGSTSDTEPGSSAGLPERRSRHRASRGQSPAAPVAIARTALRALPSAVARDAVALSVLAAVVALALGKLLDAAGASRLDWLPFAIVAVVGAVGRSGSWAARTLAPVGVLLLCARSFAAPVVLADAAPAVAVAALGGAAVLHVRSLRFARGFVPLSLLGVVLLGASVPGGPQLLLKAAGIGLLWPLILLVAASTRPADRGRLVTALWGCALAEAVLAVLESLVHVGWLTQSLLASRSDDAYVVRGNRILGDWTNRAQGTTGYPIPLAVLLVVGLLVTVFGPIRRRRALLVPAAALLVLAILLTGTRSAFVFGGAALALGAVLRTRARASRRTTVLVSVAAGAAVAATAGAFLASSLSSKDFSLAHRGGIVESAVQLFRLPLLNVLFGSGYNAGPRLQQAGYLTVDTATVVDNALVTQLANTGVVGLALLVGVLVAAYLRAATLGRATIVALALSMLYFDLQYWHLMTLLLWFTVGTADRLVAPPPWWSRLRARVRGPARAAATTAGGR